MTTGMGRKDMRQTSKVFSVFPCLWRALGYLRACPTDKDWIFYRTFFRQNLGLGEGGETGSGWALISEAVHSPRVTHLTYTVT